MSKKISHKEVRRRMKMNEMVEAQHWVVEHRQKITVGAVIVIALALFAYLYTDYRQKTRINALNQYSEALDTASNENLDEALLFAEQVIETYSSTRAYLPALMLKGDILFQQNKPNEALECYEQLARSDEPKLVPAALLGKAACYENLEQPDLAKAAYQQILDQFRSSGFEQEARFLLAQLLEREGDTKKAISLYKEIPEASSVWYAEAARRLQWLETPVVKLPVTQASEPS